MPNSFIRRTGYGLSAAGLVLLLITGCNNSEEIGLEITPQGDRFHYIVDSTTTVTASTLRQDSLTAEKRAPVLLGCLNDPVFGRSYAHLVTQLRLSSNDVDFGANARIDSAVVLLKYQGYYGDTTALQTLRVYELTRDIYFDSTYYSNFRMEGGFNPAEKLAEREFYPMPDQDSLLIRLTNDFGNKLIQTDTANLSSNTTWLKFFKGLYFEAQPVAQGGAVTYFDLKGSKSRLTLYYHNDVNDSLRYDVVINTNCSWINLFSHDYAGTPVAGLINDSTGTNPDVYLQSMSGLRSRLKFGFPEEVLARAGDGIAINRAELIITLADDPTSGQFLKPLSLRVYNAKKNGQNEFIDDLTEGEDFYGGSYNLQKSSYRFNITMHVQNLLHPDPAQRIEDNGMFLVITDERTGGNRVILKNGIADGGMKLVLTYTPLK